ncbi:Uncharacterised protein [Mesomycoplasma dispar]|uniref:Uncharacterized protein n=1 Tax=Mesomycoplasma dispar TaxID=86660 RepID=A0AAJ5NR37_9BACT|nr:hypothetical protein [Mesomycoplasma dispar]AJR12495.1 hypothetical protein MDIS_04050 [Mesomycoplasma dispar]ATP60017.1 hypothetical protein CSW10_03825 [Mesomycoplasma dispar]VEU62761.1 Uncharacterised protein [Mesomycoplasma dispar]
MLKNSKSNFWTFFSIGMWFWVQSAILISVGGYLVYVYDVQNQYQFSKISQHQFWNAKKNVLTFEGVEPPFFVDEIDREKAKKRPKTTVIESKLVNNFNDFRDKYVFVSKNPQPSFQKNGLEFKSKQLQNAYLIKNTNDLVDLIMTNKKKSNETSQEFFLRTSIEKDVNHLLKEVNLAEKDVIILNNYVSQLFGIWGDRREKGLNLVDFSFDQKSKTIKLEWKFQNYRANAAIVQKIGAYDWFKSYILLVDKNKIDTLKNISFESVFS